MINGNIFNTGLSKPRVLVAPLDWGLGHATRCIPIINELIKQDCEVFIAADKSLKFLLKKEFPGLVFLSIRGYRIKYSRNGSLLLFKILLQFPKIFFAVFKENLWLKKIIDKHSIDAVISDNRFGLYNKKIISIYITHQLLIKAGNKIFEKFARKIHYHFIEKYNYCWVPDCKENSLAGDLSHPVSMPSNVVYIGPLSRFEKLSNIPIKYNLLIALSGPEPQRTIFEKAIMTQLETFKKKVLIVRGLPGEKIKANFSCESVEVINHLSAQELNMAFLQSEMIISRSGYSTIMDLVKLGKNAILVPTPGQGEQEFLAKYLMEKKFFYSAPQKKISLDRVTTQAISFPFNKPEFPDSEYKKVTGEFVQLLKNRPQVS